jgi:hypothetical protein
MPISTTYRALLIDFGETRSSHWTGRNGLRANPNGPPESGAALTPDKSTNRARGAKCRTVACNRAVSTHQPFAVTTFAAS